MWIPPHGFADYLWGGQPAGRCGGSPKPPGSEQLQRTDVPARCLPQSPDGCLHPFTALNSALWGPAFLPCQADSCTRGARGSAEEKPSPTSVAPKSVITPKLCPDSPGTHTPEASRVPLSRSRKKRFASWARTPTPLPGHSTASPPADQASC